MMRMKMGQLRRLILEADSRVIDVIVDKARTMDARSQFPMHPDSIVATFVSPVRLYRAIDEREFKHVLSTGTFTGGGYAVKAERLHGASWGSNVSDVISWANRQRGDRLEDEIYLAKLPDASGMSFFHLDPGIDLDPSGPSMQPAKLRLERIYTGLGASVSGVSLEDVEIFKVRPDGQMTSMDVT